MNLASTACLFVKVGDAVCATETEAIEANLKATNSQVSMEIVEWVSQDDFVKRTEGKKFGIIYVGAHADGYGFGASGAFWGHSWEELGIGICTADCMTPKGVLFMACCRGGMKTVALKILKCCDKIDYIVGANQGTTGGDLVAAFTAFIREVKKGAGPMRATERAAGATGENYTCHDRQELELDVTLARQLDAIQHYQNIILAQQSKILEKLEVLVPSKKAPEPAAELEQKA